jgi:restriction system protein
MSKNSLFALLLRSPWWISFAVAAALALAARFIIPEKYADYAMSIAIPFVVIGAIAAWKQSREPGAARVASTLDAIAEMSWREFSALMEQAFQRDGYAVTRTNGAADFRLVKEGRISLVNCKRWKAASHGLEPLRELEDARKAQGVQEAIYVASGQITDNARRFAVVSGIVLMQGSELTRLLRLPKTRRSAKAA